jgi:hypothetical protein
MKPRAALTGADLCPGEMRRGGDSTGNGPIAYLQ